KKISDQLAYDATISQIFLGSMWGSWGIWAPNKWIAASNVVGSAGVSKHLSGKSTYVASQNYHVKIGLYDASSLHEGMVYVLVHVAAEYETAIYTGWNAYGIDRADFRYEDAF